MVYDRIIGKFLVLDSTYANDDYHKTLYLERAAHCAHFMTKCLGESMCCM